MIDRDARRELLSTRIALERLELARDVERARAALRLPPLLRALVAPLFGAPAPHGGSRAARLTHTVFDLLRRYPMLASSLGLVTPLLRGHAWLRRLALAGALAGGALTAWRASRAPMPAPSPPSPPSP